MERLKISEQDIVNALCVYIARKKQIKPEEVEIELFYDDDEGFSADAYAGGLKQNLTTANIIEALRMRLEEFLNEDPYSGIELVFDDEEGIIALVH